MKKDEYNSRVRMVRGILSLPLMIFSGSALAKRLKLDYEEKMKLAKEQKELETKITIVNQRLDLLSHSAENINEELKELEKRIKKIENEKKN